MPLSTKMYYPEEKVVQRQQNLKYGTGVKSRLVGCGQFGLSTPLI